jgi:putative MATE family efflux protein
MRKIFSPYPYNGGRRTIFKEENGNFIDKTNGSCKNKKSFHTLPDSVFQAATGLFFCKGADSVTQLIERFLACDRTLKPGEIRGPLPSIREGYSTAFRIAWPSIVETVLISLISSVDTMMVGGCGPAAIAAVGLTTQPRFVFLALILSFNVGVTAVISRRKGAEDEEGVQRCLKQAVAISAAASLVLTLLSFFLAEPLVMLAGAESDTVDYATDYFRIVMIGALFSNIGLTINAAQRGVGNTKISMTTNLIANVVNLFFNWLLINGVWFFPELGVTGAAVATALGNLVAMLLSVRSVCRKKATLKLFSSVSWGFDRATVSSLLNVASSAAVEQVFMRIGFFLYAAMVARLGTNAYATHQICMNILNLSFAVGDGLSIASSALVGQNLGAQRPDLSKLYCTIAQRIAFCFSTVIFLIFFFGRFFLVGLFTDDGTIIQAGSQLLVIAAFTTHIQTAQVILSGCLRGAGDTRFVAGVSFLSIGLVRPLLTYLFCFPFDWGLVGAWVTLLVDQTMRMVLNKLRFNGGKWTQKKL